MSAENALTSPPVAENHVAHPAVKYLYKASVELEMPLQLGNTPRGYRRIVYIKGGTFVGPDMRGTVLPGGGDWLVVRPDGVAEVEIRAVGRTDDGELIYVDYRGLFHAPREVMQRIAKREFGDAAEYYFRVTAFYETASERYAWLNRIVALGFGVFTAQGIDLTVYDIV
jgi:hypothetical protein